MFHSENILSSLPNQKQIAVLKMFTFIFSRNLDKKVKEGLYSRYTIDSRYIVKPV